MTKSISKKGGLETIAGRAGFASTLYELTHCLTLRSISSSIRSQCPVPQRLWPQIMLLMIAFSNILICPPSIIFLTLEDMSRVRLTYGLLQISIYFSTTDQVQTAAFSRLMCGLRTSIVTWRFSIRILTYFLMFSSRDMASQGSGKNMNSQKIMRKLIAKNL